MAIFFSRKSVQRGSSWNLDFVFDLTWPLSPTQKTTWEKLGGQYEVFFDFKVAIRGQFFFSRLGLVLLRGAIYSRSSDNKVITAKPSFMLSLSISSACLILALCRIIPLCREHPLYLAALGYYTNL